MTEAKDFHPLALWPAGRRTVGLFAFLQKKNGVFIIFQNGNDGKKQERVRRWEQNGFEGMNREAPSLGRRDVWSREGPASGEVNFVLSGQTHVEWPAEGLSSTGAPGQLALRRTPTRCGASTPSLLQSALHPPPC